MTGTATPLPPISSSNFHIIGLNSLRVLLSLTAGVISFCVSPSRPSAEVGEDRTDKDAHLGTINKLRRVLMVHMIAHLGCLVYQVCKGGLQRCLWGVT